MSEQELDNLREWLIWHVFRNEDYMFLPYYASGGRSYREDEDRKDRISNLLAMVASLYNLLHKEVKGEKYEYFFHWANKVGSWVEDNVFDDILSGGKELNFND